MSSKSTATPENALTRDEVDARLAGRALARFATYRRDGMIHLTPIWFTWDGTRFRMTLGAGRVHLKNLSHDPRATILIDEDPRVEQGLAAGAWAIMARGRAELSQDPDLIREVTLDVLARALGADDAQTYLEPIMAEGRTVVTLEPSDWLTWDYNKVD
jgi:PPOX class probable F420-dependent enzyme